MKLKSVFTLCIVLLTSLSSLSLFADNQVEPAPNGISLPKGYQDWKVISQSHRTDNKTVRIILGNDTAVKAARANNTNPWPKGTILGKLVWKQKNEEFWPTAIAPDQFVHAEFMLKDSEKFKETGGWGYARWLGMEQKAYGEDKDFANECMACHAPVKSKDWVYTTPAEMP